MAVIKPYCLAPGSNHHMSFKGGKLCGRRATVGVGRKARGGKHDGNSVQFAGDGQLRSNGYRICDCGLLACVRNKAAIHRTLGSDTIDGVSLSGSRNLFIFRHLLAVVMDESMADSMASCPAAAVHAGPSQQRQHQRENQRHSHRDGNQPSHCIMNSGLYPQFISKSKSYLIQVVGHFA